MRRQYTTLWATPAVVTSRSRHHLETRRLCQMKSWVEINQSFLFCLFVLFSLSSLSFYSLFCRLLFPLLILIYTLSNKSGRFLESHALSGFVVCNIERFLLLLLDIVIAAKVAEKAFLVPPSSTNSRLKAMS